MRSISEAAGGSIHITNYKRQSQLSNLSCQQDQQEPKNPPTTSAKKKITKPTLMTSDKKRKAAATRIRTSSFELM